MTDSETLLAIYTVVAELAYWVPFGIGVFLSYIVFNVMFRWLR